MLKQLPEYPKPPVRRPCQEIQRTKAQENYQMIYLFCLVPLMLIN
jgi:hypothetical protein